MNEIPDLPLRNGLSLAQVTTLRLGGPCADVVVADTEELLVETVAAADSEGAAVLLVAGGSNLVVADDGWPGRVILVRTAGIDVDGDTVTVAAGQPWDAFVALMVESGRVGVEALSGIPGSVGATPIQNVGAYGQEVADVIDEVLVWDRVRGTERWLPAAQCQFSYRDSVFKQRPADFVVLQVRFRLPMSDVSAPVRYAELASSLGIEVGSTAPLHRVREAVLALRRGKGMVLDDDDHDSWSAGSFFTNPVLTVEQAATLPAEAPRYPAGDGKLKTSAAWLIQHAGIAKGFAVAPDAPVSVSTKHTLALTNRGGARTEDLLELARVIQEQVREVYGLVLEPEPVLVGCAL